MFSGLLQPTHLLILLAVVLIFLGPKRLPSAGRAIGQGLREFKDSINREPQPLAEATATADELSDTQTCVVLGRLELARGDLDAAVRHLGTLPGRMLRR